ncbi:MAG TPA: DUF4936 family protein [Burkholderiaceae bacterium]|nr:DUF4936 family protein [Burkholderiaceae bacterium]
MDVYVYYRVKNARKFELEARLRALQAGLARSCGIQTRLKRRPGSVDDCQTWMEIYLDVPAHFDTALADAVRTAGLLALIEGQRHIEYFVDCSVCA